MSLTANIDPTENAFTGNPVYLSVETTSMATYNIMYFVNFEFMRSIFTGNGNGSFKVNIAEVLETLFVDIPPLTDSSEMLISLSDKRYNKAVVTITLQNEEEETATLVVTAWRGGISKRAFKKLHEEGNNIFSLKFLNESCNFFFTTRSNDWRITMRETELYPLCFIYPEHELKITELLTGQSLAVPGTAGNFYALNLEAVRLKFFTDYGVLANLFDVYSGDAVFRRYDEITDDYYSDRIRTEIQEAVTVKTGFKRPQEIRFLLDLLSSDDVYLAGYGREEIKVIPSAEEFSYRVRPDAPQNVTLKLTFAEKESNWTGEITESGYRKPRVHSKEFSKQFN